MDYQVLQGNCTEVLDTVTETVDLTFLDPPFNQSKDYALHNDNMPDADYWAWMQSLCARVLELTSEGGGIYFMQREKNAEAVLRCLREAGWTLQNLVIWKKMTSAVPVTNRFGKHYQIIAFATKGGKPRLFHKLRISPPLPANYKYERENGMYVTDVWDDIRELTSGYFAGDEALRAENGERFHKQQSPIALLLRIILSSTKVGDTILDPFAGTGTTLVVAHQLGRQSIGVELDPNNAQAIEKRLTNIRESDRVERFYDDYRHTEDLATLWGSFAPALSKQEEADNVFDLPLFRTSRSE